MNIISKYIKESISFYNNPNPFKTKNQEFNFLFYGISLVLVIMGTLLFYIIKGYLITGFYEYLTVSVAIMIFILIYFFSQKLKEIIEKNKSVKSELKIDIQQIKIENVSKYIPTEEIVDEKKVNKMDANCTKLLINIREELEISEKKQFVYLLLSLKNYKFTSETDVWFIKLFKSIFNIEITPTYLSQERNKLEIILSNKGNLNKNEKKYLKLYNDMIEKIELKYLNQ